MSYQMYSCIIIHNLNLMKTQEFYFSLRKYNDKAELDLHV